VRSSSDGFFGGIGDALGNFLGSGETSDAADESLAAILRGGTAAILKEFGVASDSGSSGSSDSGSGSSGSRRRSRMPQWVWGIGGLLGIILIIELLTRG